MLDLSTWGLFGLFVGTFLAATVIPFSSDALYIAVLQAVDHPVSCLLVGTAGNWLGSMLSYGIGWYGKWEWAERWLRVKPETLKGQKRYINKYGVWIALLSWVPLVGDLIPIALGFYKTRPFVTSLLLLVGKGGRFVIWTLLLDLF